MRWIDTSDPAERVIGRALRSQAEAVGDDPFLRQDDLTLTFAEVERRTNAIGNALRTLGVERGSRVSLMMDSSVDMALTAIAVNKLGAAWVPVNTAYKGDWLAEGILGARSEVLVVDHAYVERVAPVVGIGPIKQLVVAGGEPDLDIEGRACTPLSELMEYDATTIDVDLDSRDLSAVMWTSGTTGKAKGVMQTHSSWLVNAALLTKSRGVQEGDAFYCCVPMFNSGGWSLNVFSALVSGLPIGIDRQFSVTTFWDRCRHYEATHILTLGAMHMFLWQAPPRDDDADNPVRVGGCVPIPHDIAAPFRERFGIDRLWSGFGQSEVMVVSLCDGDRQWKPSSCGLPASHLDVQLLDDDDRPVATGEVGEICVRPKEPDIMFAGYFDDPGNTVKAFRNLWYHTGDLGRFDDDGELFFVDRKTDLMRFAGRNIASADVERAVLSHPDVTEVAAVGVAAGDLAGEAEVMVAVVRKPDSSLTADELARHIDERAPYYLVPRYIAFVDELPHTPTGKVQKAKIRAEGLPADAWDRVGAGFKATR